MPVGVVCTGQKKTEGRGRGLWSVLTQNAAQVGGHVPALSPWTVLPCGYPPCLGHDNAYLSWVRLWSWIPTTLPMSLPCLVA